MFLVRLVGGVVFVAAIYGLSLFLPAGTLHWWRAWVLLGVTVLSTMISTVYLSSANPDIVRERWKPPIRKDQPLEDKILSILLLLFYAWSLIMTPLDVFRWHLLPKPGVTVSSLGLVLYISSWIIITRVLRENAFASASVRYQSERQHRVIDTGPYRIAETSAGPL